MGNDEAFRKVRDKLAGFESDIRDDSWHLFEQHRRGKGRRRKLAGALGVGMLVIFILGVLVGSRIFLERRREATRQLGQSAIAVQQRGGGLEIKETDKTTGLRSHVFGLPGGIPKKARASGNAFKFPVKANHRLPEAAPVNSGIIPQRNDTLTAFSLSGSRSPGISGVLPNIDPLYYAVNLQLPAIHCSGEPIGVDPIRPGRRFQLSVGAAIRANYTNPSENRLTMGPAVFNTFSINRKLSLRGGLALMREHANVSNQNPLFTKDAVKWLNRGDYRWWNLDIPIDMQIKLHQNPKLILSGLLGISSSLSWGEHFRELYQKDKIVTTILALHNGEVREVEELASSRDAPVTGRRDGAFFAPVSYFNASMILEKKISTRSSLAIEPQFRYPIGGVTSRNLKFTSIGLQIRVLYQ